MKFLDRKEYNKMIEELNSNKDVEDSAQKELTERYDELLCKLSDYEEIVLLLNICIAYDRDDNIEELYQYYLKIVKMLDDHCGIGLKNLYYIYYCMGVFSFKLHDYDKAQMYFEKCVEQIYHINPDPLGDEGKKENTLINTTYIQAEILISYVMEYKQIGEGSYNAICNILDSKKLSEDLTVQEILDDEPKTVVDNFFKKNHSRIYEKAEELMQKEIIHVLSHCFSEYSVYLRKKQAEPEKIFLWEIMSEKFISYLGEKMIACRAIIYAEHGHYCQAIDMMKKQYDKLSKGSVEKERAELAFFIYYFNNQIGSYIDSYAEVCKDDFLQYAQKKKSTDTKFYAWIVDFREHFAKALKLEEEKNIKESIKELEKLEEKCKEIDNLIKKQNYIHPQILEEKHRLLLAYQILRSYLQINDRRDSVGERHADNSLFEKCVMFNRKDAVKKSKKGCEEHRWEKNADEQIELQGVSLSIYGMTDDVCDELEKQFCSKINHTDKKMTSRQKVVIYDEEIEIETLIDNTGTDLTYFIYCKEKECINELQTIKEEKGINAYINDNLLSIIKTAYIQETLEKCNLCANKWDEFFIIAPITDNATFAFQNQSIKEYLAVIEDDAEEKNLFSDDHGYETSVWRTLNGIRKIDYQIDINQKKMKQWRLYFYHEQWLYFFEEETYQFVPFKFLDSVKIIGGLMKQLQKYPHRTNDKRHKCQCKSKLNKCLCEKWPLDDKKKETRIIKDLLLSLSVGLPAKKEKYCTIIFTNKLQEEQPIEDMLILLSDEVDLDYKFRVCLKNISSICEENRSMEGQDEQSPNEHSSNSEVEEKCKGLIETIEKYIGENRKNLPDASEDYQKMITLSQEIKENCKGATVEQFEDFKERWKRIISRDI